MRISIMNQGRRIFPQSMSRFWLRRLCEATLFVGLAVVVLYVWARFIPTGYSLPIGLAVSDVAAIVAASVVLLTTILSLWLPHEHTNITSTVVYLMAVAVVATLIFTSGGASSPFASAWFIVAVFAGFFSIVVTGLMIALVLAQIILMTATSALEIPQILTYLFFGLLPILLSSVLWHRQPDKKVDKSFNDLATKLSTVEGKSDVVINTIDDGVLAINRSGIIDLINPSAQAMIGWNRGDALGLDWRSVLKLVNAEGREIQEIENPVAQSLANNKPTHSDILSLLTSSGKKILVSIVSSPVGKNGDGIIVVFRDITKEKAEEREQAEFISTASHEMRTPVASIEGYLGLALNPATANIDEKARDFITKAHESAQHLGELFQDLLDISKAEDGRLKNEPKVIDVTATVSDIFEGLSHLATDKQLHYIFKPNPSLEVESSERRLQPVFYADVDPSHFREVIGNLIENAIKYTPKGDVVVDVTGDDRLVSVSIQDTGIGIPAEDIPHLFQKFYRVDNSDTREIGGTGLGLYLCRRLAEAMGGHLRVESEYKRGSTFFLDLPRMSHEDAMERLNATPEETVAATPTIIPETTRPTPTPESTPPVALQPVPQSVKIPVVTPESAPQQPIEPAAPTAQPLENMTLADVEAMVARRAEALKVPPRSSN